MTSNNYFQDPDFWSICFMLRRALCSCLGSNVCTHKFRKFSPTKLAKQNRKIMRTKYLLKLKYCGYNLKNNIIFQKNIFPLILLPWSHFGRRWWHFLDFEDQSRATIGSEWTRWMAKNTCSSSFTVYRTCREICWSFFFCYEAYFPIRSRLWIFSLGFSFLDFSDFSLFFSW